MVAIRLTRRGMKKRPFYRIVVADKAFPRDGRFLEIVGTYDPLAKEKGVILKQERVKHWLSQGAQPTQTVKHIFKKYLN